MQHQNLILDTDSYKVTHARQYPPGTERVYSYYESRGGAFDEIVWFGLQYVLTEHLLRPVTQDDIEEADSLFSSHFGDRTLFNRVGWELLVQRHGGRLPVRIRALPEGTVVTPGQVLMTVENTDAEFFWLTNYLETLLCQVWYPATVASNSRAIGKIILDSLKETGSPEQLPYKLHDFGFRGSTTAASAGIGGCAHLVNFEGTDTVRALVVARDYYGEPVAGHSIPASEHSTITAWGRAGELDAYRNMLRQYPTGLVACVSDSYDIYAACELWGTTLKDEVLARSGTLVIRPDSGNPPQVVERVLHTLGKHFGFTVNPQGYAELPPQVRVIQGDGVDRDTIREILRVMRMNRWSANNIAFGCGGGLLQKLNRDTCKFAFKASAVQVAGQWRDVRKHPVTDPGKASKAGRFDGLPTVYENGELIVREKLSDIRARASLLQT